MCDKRELGLYIREFIYTLKILLVATREALDITIIHYSQMRVFVSHLINCSAVIPNLRDDMNLPPNL